MDHAITHQDSMPESTYRWLAHRAQPSYGQPLICTNPILTRLLTVSNHRPPARAQGAQGIAPRSYPLFAGPATETIAQPQIAASEQYNKPGTLNIPPGYATVIHTLTPSGMIKVGMDNKYPRQDSVLSCPAQIKPDTAPSRIGDRAANYALDPQTEPLDLRAVKGPSFAGLDRLDYITDRKPGSRPY
ncbi:hypothetical protein ACL2XP_25430 [Sodalis sp. RH21]|uniref:hypothetical protein n=1 Tax=unclassified Sodalis (in: enterobacteria) TaxID=2636512 RepID=UPI0039B55BFA